MQAGDTLCGALERLLQCRAVRDRSAEVLPYALAGLGSPTARLRLIAAQQVRDALKYADPQSAAALAPSALPLLAALLADRDTPVAGSAADAIVAAVFSAPDEALALLLSPSGGLSGGAAHAAFAAAAQHADATVRLRAMSLASRIAGLGPLAANAVAASGVLEGLCREVQGAVSPSGDLLAALAAMEALGELAESDAAAAAGLAAVPLRVLPLLSAAVAAEAADCALRARAAVVGARIVGAALRSGAADALEQAEGFVGALMGPLRDDDSARREARAGAVEARGDLRCKPPRHSAAHIASLALQQKCPVLAVALRLCFPCASTAFLLRFAAFCTAAFAVLRDPG